MFKRLNLQDGRVLSNDWRLSDRYLQWSTGHRWPFWFGQPTYTRMPD
jgi:hypothetical protein